MINAMTTKKTDNKSNDSNGIYHNKKNIGVVEMEKKYCPFCEKFFYTWDVWEDHLYGEHKEKTVIINGHVKVRKD